MGASGYLTKESASEDLVQAIQKMLTGGEYISASIEEELFNFARHEHDQPLYNALSDREKTGFLPDYFKKVTQGDC